MKITISEFFKMTQILRMLYGVQIAQTFFESNLENFGFSVHDLQSRLQDDKINLTTE